MWDRYKFQLLEFVMRPMYFHMALSVGLRLSLNRSGWRSTVRDRIYSLPFKWEWTHDPTFGTDQKEVEVFMENNENV